MVELVKLGAGSGFIHEKISGFAASRPVTFAPEHSGPFNFCLKLRRAKVEILATKRVKPLVLFKVQTFFKIKPVVLCNLRLESIRIAFHA